MITGPELEGLQQYSNALMARLREEVPGITGIVLFLFGLTMTFVGSEPNLKRRLLRSRQAARA